MAFPAKCTMFFKQGNSGWSETWYLTVDALNEALVALDTLSGSRLPLCSNQTVIQYLRVSNTLNPQLSLISAVQKNLPALGAQDTPWQGILARYQTGSGNRRMLCLRGVPDNIIVNGQFTNDPTWSRDFAAYNRALLRGGWQMRVTKFADVPKVVNAIDTAGLVTTAVNHGYSGGNQVYFLRTHYDGGGLVRGPWLILTVPSPTTFSLQSWGTGQQASGGKVRLFAVQYPAVASGEIIRASKHQPGRVFGQPLGRRRRVG